MLTSSEPTNLTSYAFKSLHLRFDHVTAPVKQILYLHSSADSLQTLTLELPIDPNTVFQVQQAFPLKNLTTLRLKFLNPAFPNSLSKFGQSVGELPCLRVLEVRQNRTHLELTSFFEPMLKTGWGERLEELTLNCEPRTMSEYIAVMQFISVHRRLKKLNVDIQVSQYSKREVDFASLDFVLDTALWKGVMATIEDLTFAVRVGLLCFTPPINLCTNLKALRHHRLTNSLQPFRLPATAERNLTSLTFAFDTRISFHVVGSCFTVLHTCERLQAFTLSCPGFLIDETSNETLTRLTNFIRTLTPRPHLKILDIAIPIPTPALQPIAEFISKCNIHTIMLGLERQISDQLRYTVTSLIKSPIILKLPFQPAWEVISFTTLKHLRIPIPHEAAMRELLSSSLVKPWGTWSLDSLHLDMAFHSQVPPKTVKCFVLELVKRIHAVKELYLSVIAFETLRPTYSCLAGLKSAVGTLKIIGRENLGDEEVRLEKESRRKGGVSVMILNGLYGVYGK